MLGGENFKIKWHKNKMVWSNEIVLSMHELTQFIFIPWNKSKPPSACDGKNVIYNTVIGVNGNMYVPIMSPPLNYPQMVFIYPWFCYIIPANLVRKKIKYTNLKLEKSRKKMGKNIMKTNLKTPCCSNKSIVIIFGSDFIYSK